MIYEMLTFVLFLYVLNKIVVQFLDTRNCIFMGHPCEILIETAIGVLYKGTDYKHKYKHFLLYNAKQNMSPCLNILHQSLKTLTLKNPQLHTTLNSLEFVVAQSL